MITFFYKPGLGCHHRDAKNLPFAGGSHRPKTRKQRFIHTHIHTTTAHTLLSTPVAVPPDIVSAFWRHRSGYTQAPWQDTTALAEPHLRRQAPFCTTSKMCLGPHFIQHTILSAILLHAFRSLHIPFACSNHISLSAHAFLTSSIHLKGGLPLPFFPSPPTYTPF